MSRWVEIFHILFSPVWLDRYSTLDFIINVYLIIILPLLLFEYNFYGKCHAFKKTDLFTVLLFIWNNWFMLLNLLVRQNIIWHDVVFSNISDFPYLYWFFYISSWYSLTNYNNIPTANSLSWTYPLLFFYKFLPYFFIFYFSSFHGMRIWSILKLNLFWFW